MADFTLTIPDDQVERVVGALCFIGRYAGSPDDMKARKDCARQVVVQYIRRTVAEVETQQAMAVALAATAPVDPITVE